MSARSAKVNSLRISRPAKLRCARAPRASRIWLTSWGEFADAAGCVASPEDISHTGRATRSCAQRSASARAAGSQCAV